ncbi:MAG: glycosyltransferase family 2 protein [Paludibacteraceae bacterium]|nr:glycosyltransferase family 2 protein [Paludibacteraceae bacterium]
MGISSRGKVSVVIPIYKAESTINRCIDSILGQTYTDFELLLIDDGSPDNAGKICDEYARLDSRVRVFHKENGGVSSARNLGVEEACGEFLVFVDADDYVEIDYLREFIKNKDADLVVSGYKSLNGDYFLPNEGRYEGLELSHAISDIIRNRSIYAPWSKLFRLDIIEKYHLRFDCKLRLGEDTTFVYYYLSYCASVKFISNDFYFYEGVFGGGKKYILSYAELDYLNKCNIAAVRQLNKNHNAQIEESFYGAKWNLLKGRYSMYTDKDSWKMYLRHHPSATLYDYTHLLQSNVYSTALTELEDLYKAGSFIEGYELLRDLSIFFTLSASQIRFKNEFQKFIYSSMKKNRLKRCDKVLSCLYPLRLLLSLIRR